MELSYRREGKGLERERERVERWKGETVGMGEGERGVFATFTLLFSIPTLYF